MQQIPLDLYQVDEPTLENFIAGRNAEALVCLRTWRDAPASAIGPVRLAHLWGEPGCGRKHLAHASAGENRIPAATTPPDALCATVRKWIATCANTCTEPALEHPRIFAITDVEALDAAGQEQVFHLVNQIQANPGNALLTTGAQAPLALPLRAELRTRLGSGLVFRLHLLDDADKSRVLDRIAKERGVRIAPDVLPWLLRHTSRDIRALVQLFDALDRHAFEHRRAITLPLLREWLARATAAQTIRDRAPDESDACRPETPPEHPPGKHQQPS